jgi:hypothetical protein
MSEQERKAIEQRLADLERMRKLLEAFMRRQPPKPTYH